MDFIRSHQLGIGDLFLLNKRQRKPREVAHIHFFGESHEIKKHRGKMLIVTVTCKQILLDPAQEIIYVGTTRRQS